jgi:biotin transport system substrate-specific component
MEMMKFITTRGLTMSALFAALLVAFGFVTVQLGFTPVPITLQTLAVMLAGAFLGAGYGFFSILLVVVLTALGLPLLHGNGGMAALLGPTGGYVWMWPISALLIGWSLSRVQGVGLRAYVLTFLAAEVFGSLLVYVSGVPWLAHVAHIPLSKALIGGCYPFLAGDAVKAAITALIAVPIRQVYSVSRLTGSGRAEVVKL